MDPSLSGIVASILCTVQAEALATVTTVQAVVASTSVDGRSNRKAESRVFSFRQNQFGIADTNPACYDAWFKDQFRCTKASFDVIVDSIESRWEGICDTIVVHVLRIEQICTILDTVAHFSFVTYLYFFHRFYLEQNLNFHI